MNLLELEGIKLKTLINELETTFPPYNPHPSDPERMVMYKSGQRSVVEWIVSKLEEENV